jgi:TrmH family RNA methyltransferase
MKSVSSRQSPIVRQFRELARTPDPAGARLLLDGIHLIRDAIAAAVELEVIAVASSWKDADGDTGLLQRAESAGARFVTVSPQVFAAVSPVRSPSGIAAIARRTPVDARAICDRSGLVLIAAHVQDPGNLGSMIRAAEAGGVSGVIVCGDSASPFSWKAVRGSMGSILRLPVAPGAAVDDAIGCVRRHGGRIVAAAPRHGRDPDAVDWRGSVALVVGGEGHGLADPTVAIADDVVTIPMADPVESLNVAVATAILVYAARRQRRPPGDVRDSSNEGRKL